MEGRDPRRGSIDGVRASVGRVVGLLDGISRKAVLLFLERSRQGIQVERSLLAGSAEAFLRKEESRSFRAQEEQYFESIPDAEGAGLKEGQLYKSGAHRPRNHAITIVHF